MSIFIKIYNNDMTEAKGMTNISNDAYATRNYEGKYFFSFQKL